MKSQTCCFTGHRIIPQHDYATLQTRLEAEITRLIHQGVRYFGAGGALGFDTMAAITVLKMKVLYPYIQLILVLPCRDQAKYWNGEDARTYSEILCRADKAACISEQYDNDCMLRRNRHLVDHSQHCICYFTGRKGGTAYTVDYAARKGLHIINLAATFD